MHGAAAYFAKLEPGAGGQERNLTLKSTPVTWPTPGNPSVDRGQERILGKAPGAPPTFS